jgi:eukaryotic-like serine/threonine-protein kinase
MTERPGAVDGRHLGGRYRMGAPLAAGGMGEVWVARDPLLDRPVAVKVLGGALAGDGRAAERLRREARAAARLDHPNIARVLDLGEHDGRPYLVMELLEGESLAGRIDRAGPMAPGAAARVVAAVADALQAAHRAGVVHRDVKPGNVFLTAEGEVKVLDFGIADIYSLGVVLYELLAGRRPFEGGSDIELAMAHVNAHPEPLGLVAPSAPPFLVAACEQAMAKDPAARPRSAAAFARLLRSPADAAPAARPVPAVAVPPVTRPLPLPGATSTAPLSLFRPVRHRPRSRRRRLLVALLLAVTALAALPAFADGLVPWVGERPQAPFAVPVPDTTAPADEPATPARRPARPTGPRRPVAGRPPTRPERQRPARPARRRPRPGRRLQRPRLRWRRLRRRRLERPRLSRTGRTGDPYLR